MKAVLGCTECHGGSLFAYCRFLWTSVSLHSVLDCKVLQHTAACSASAVSLLCSWRIFQEDHNSCSKPGLSGISSPRSTPGWSLYALICNPLYKRHDDEKAQIAVSQSTDVELRAGSIAVMNSQVPPVLGRMGLTPAVQCERHPGDMLPNSG